MPKLSDPPAGYSLPLVSQLHSGVPLFLLKMHSRVTFPPGCTSNSPCLPLNEELLITEYWICGGSDSDEMFMKLRS